MDGNADKGNLHKGSKMETAEGTDDIDTMIDKSGCANAYYKLEECLVENNRSFKICQQHVLNLKKCNDLKNRKAQS
jgi:hypothetical protein